MAIIILIPVPLCFPPIFFFKIKRRKIKNTSYSSFLELEVNFLIIIITSKLLTKPLQRKE